MLFHKITLMKKVASIQPGKQVNGLKLGLIVSFAMTTAYLFYKKKRKVKTGEAECHESKLQNSLNMERYVFSLPHESGIIEAVVEQGGECYAVHLDGKYKGNMWQDENMGMKWSTLDSELKPYLFELAKSLSEVFSRKGFPALLLGTYTEIISTDFKSSETLEVILKEDTDIEVFVAFLKDEVQNLVTFEEHLDLIVKKENDSYFIIVGVN